MRQAPIRRRFLATAAGTAALVAFASILATWSAPAAALDGPNIFKVEETWELVVTSANPTSGGPQLNTLMSPYSDADDYYGLFTINYIDLPAFSVGGMQAQLWNDKTALSNDPHREGIPLQNDNETITWTQTLELAAGTLSFHVQNGTSTTWGAFGELDYCRAEYPVTGVTNLNGYTPDTSVEYAQKWGLERDRISNLRITRVRKWDGEGFLVSDDSTVIPVLSN